MTSLEPEDEPGSAQWWDAHLQRLDRRRPRSGGFTVERIVDEALALADSEGLDALTVRSLAARLGTSSATLYRHVASVDELLILMIDRVLGEITPPGTHLGPRDRVVVHTHRFREVLLDHPGVVPALRLGTLLGPNAMRSAACGLNLLLELGFTPAQAVPAYLALIDYVLGAVFFDSASVGDARGRRQHEGIATVFVENRAHFRVSSPDEVFRIGVDAFLEGLLARRDTPVVTDAGHQLDEASDDRYGIGTGTEEGQS